LCPEALQQARRAQAGPPIKPATRSLAQARTPEAIRRMPEPLWRSLELASVLMNVDADLTQPPLLSEGD